MNVYLVLWEILLSSASDSLTLSLFPSVFIFNASKAEMIYGMEVSPLVATSLSVTASVSSFCVAQATLHSFYASLNSNRSS